MKDPQVSVKVGKLVGRLASTTNIQLKQSAAIVSLRDSFTLGESD